MTHDKQKTIAASFRARMPSSGSKWYTPEVTAVYSTLLDMCTKESTKGGYWLKFDQLPDNCSDELFEDVKYRLECEGFRIADYDGPVYSIDWVERCAYKCDALNVQMLNPVMLKNATEDTAYDLCILIVEACNHRALNDKASYCVTASYLKYTALDIRMHSALEVPVVQRLIVMLNEQGFKTEELQLRDNDFIDITW